jgi:DNA-binding Lrp family transcriptional regulator
MVDLLAGLPEVDGYLQLPNRIVDHLLPLLAPYSQLVYVRLYRLSWGFGKPLCTVSLPRIAEKTQISQSSVQRAIADLEKKGLIRKAEHVFGKHRPQGITYEVVTGTSLVAETSPVRRNSPVPQTTNKYLKEIHEKGSHENPIYEARKIALRFREINHGRSDYSLEQLRADVTTALEGQGIGVDATTLDEALRGIKL